MTQYVLEEVAADDFMVWNVLAIQDGKTRHICQCQEQIPAKRIKQALEWLDTADERRISLPTRTSKPKKVPEWDIVFEPIPKAAPKRRTKP